MCVIVLQWKCSLAISKWRKWKLGQRFLRFYVFWPDTSKKRKKSRFLDFQKNVKNVFSNYAGDPSTRSRTDSINIGAIWAGIESYAF